MMSDLKERKIIVSMFASLDGYMEGPDHDISWHVWNEEMDAYMMEFFTYVDTFIFGRKSYELMIDYWPKETGKFADIMNNTPKLVFSRTLESVHWNATLKKQVNPQELEALKKQKGKDLVLFAGADITRSFIEHKLIDEFRIILNPVVLGKGTPLFKMLAEPLNLELSATKTFKGENVLLIYRPMYFSH